MAERRSEYVEVAKQLAATGDVDAFMADPSWSKYDRREILALALYTIEYEAAVRDRRSKRQRRAMALLRTFLTPAQQECLRRSGYYFFVRGSLGNRYCLNPRTAMVWRCELHGKHWRRIASYCLHDYAEDEPGFVSRFPNDGKRSVVPPADRTLAHLLLLRADEADFRRRANENPRYGLGWQEQAMLLGERRRIDRQVEEATAA